MSYLNVTNVSHSFGGRQILENVSFKLLRGEHVGLVGANGEGKSTFLNIVTGHVLPDEGKVEWPGKVTVGYLDQQSTLEKGMTIREVLRTAFDGMYAMEQQMLELYDKMGDASPEELDKMMNTVGEIQSELEHSGFYSLDSKIEEFANGLGLGSIGLDKDVSELSGGQRSKVLLTKLLLQNSQILLLDEPTNYLDVEHIEWLTKFLQNYEHAFILISHDIPFLNKVVNVIYHLENCELTRYSGDYDKFHEMYAIYQSQKAAAYERQQQEVAKLEDFIARNKARVATTNMAKSRQRKLDKMEMIEKPREKLKPTFKFTEARTPSRFIVEAKDLVLGYDSPLTRPVTFNLERGQKIAIRGVNGLGKTTLLKTILGIIPPVSGKVELGEFLEPGYFEQEEREKNENTALDDVWNEYPGLTNYEVRAALAGCGLTNEHITSKVFVLSGGEAAKVRLCKLMLKDVNWLVLDEPTNHLDVDAKDELKRALKEFKGSVLLVSHEPEFYEDWVDKVWNIEDWTTKIIYYCKHKIQKRSAVILRQNAFFTAAAFLAYTFLKNLEQIRLFLRHKFVPRRQKCSTLACCFQIMEHIPFGSHQLLAVLTQQIRRMVGSNAIKALLRAEPHAAVARNAHIWTSQTMQRHAAQGHDYLRLNNLQLTLQPLLGAKIAFGNIRCTVILRSAFDHVRGQHSVTRHLCCPQSLVQ